LVPSLEVEEAREGVLPEQWVPGNLMATCSAEAMPHQSLGLESDTLPSSLNGTTEVDVFEVQEIAFVEWPLFRNDRPSEQHGRPGDPVDGLVRRLLQIDRSVTQERLPPGSCSSEWSASRQQRRKIVEAARRFLTLPVVE
jgi:hypothetical protein